MDDCWHPTRNGWRSDFQSPPFDIANTVGPRTSAGRLISQRCLETNHGFTGQVKKAATRIIIGATLDGQPTLFERIKGKPFALECTVDTPLSPQTYIPVELGWLPTEPGVDNRCELIVYGSDNGQALCTEFQHRAGDGPIGRLKVAVVSKIIDIGEPEFVYKETLLSS